jgi:hypothetical protein
MEGFCGRACGSVTLTRAQLAMLIEGIGGLEPTLAVPVFLQK